MAKSTARRIISFLPLKSKLGVRRLAAVAGGWYQQVL
jgi:hypothetical protein